MMGRGPAENPRTPGGARWLNEVRQWWADSGNRLQFPVDGLTSASRAAGTHELVFAGTDPKLANLPPGKYKLMVEAAREHGGEETLSIPFTWPATTAQTGIAQGRTELGAVEPSWDKGTYGVRFSVVVSLLGVSRELAKAKQRQKDTGQH